MSNLIFPALPGLAWNVKNIPKFSTLIHAAASGKEYRAAQMAYPLWEFDLEYEVLRQASAFLELQTLQQLFLSVKGQWDSFLYSNPNDKTVAFQSFGTGDGSDRTFQLTRTFLGLNEPVNNVDATGGAPSIYVNGTLKSTPADYSIDSAGMVTFVSAPANTAALTWSGSYYYRVRFLLDAPEFNQFMYQLWNLQKLNFHGSVMNKV